MNTNFFPDLREFSPQDSEPGDQFSAWLSSATAPHLSPPIPPSLPAPTPSPGLHSPSMATRNGGGTSGTSARSKGIRRTPRNNPISFAGQSSRGTRDEGDYVRARRNRGIINSGRGYASVPTILLGEPEVPLMDLLPSTLHESGLELGDTSGLIMGPVTAAPIQTQQPVVPPLPNYVSPGGFAGNSMECHSRKSLFPTLASNSNSVHIKDEGMADVGSESSNTNANAGAGGEDWADVTIQPLYLESDRKRFNVPLEWEERFRNAPSHETRYILLDELEKLGQKFVDELKRERKEEYYNRMHAKPDLSPKQKVTIRGRIHSKLNPFVKKQTTEVQRVIQQFLVRQIPLP